MNFKELLKMECQVRNKTIIGLKYTFQIPTEINFLTVRNKTIIGLKFRHRVPFTNGERVRNKTIIGLKFI